MKDSARYAKIVEWSDEDQCYIGRIPGLIRGGCHGPDEQSVFAELCEIAEEVIASFHADGDPLPPPTNNGNLHKLLAEWDGKSAEVREILESEESIRTRRSLAG
jgi:predicted RNase H-like HicB family nuclease